MAIVGYNDAGWPIYDTRGSWADTPKWAEGRSPQFQDYVASGGDPRKKSQFENYQLQQQRNAGMSDFVNRMAMGDPSLDKTRNQFYGDYGTASNALNAFLATSPESMDNIYKPYVTSTQGRITSLLDDPDSVKQSAAYKFRLGQGIEGVNSSLAASGMLGSGNGLDAINEYDKEQE